MTAQDDSDRRTLQDADPVRHLQGRRTHWLRSLALRLAVLLTLALLPLAILAFEQTRRLQSELEQVRALNFHAVTAEIARREATEISRASGVARALAVSFPLFARDGPAPCATAARDAVAAAPTRITFAGFLGRDGAFICASHPDLGAWDTGIDPSATKTVVSTATRGPVEDAPVILIHEPARSPDGALAGHAVVAIAARDITLPNGAAGQEVDVALVNGDGAVIAATRDAETVRRMLPDTLGNGADVSDSSFAEIDAAGRARRYVVEPILSGVVYAIGISAPDTARSNVLRIPPAAVPLVMWLASVGLVLGVLERSLMGPVRTIGRHMRRFGDTRKLPARPLRARTLPSELATIEETFIDVAEQMRKDERLLIDALSEQRALLREVHHRVKNNLQIISSIINLQVRNAQSPETEDALSRISTRISSLAAVHRRLYESDSVRRMRFDMLLREVLRTLIDSARMAPDAPGAGQAPTNIDAEFDLIALQLTPDQGLSAAMFAVEAVTNALKYAEPDDTGRRWLRVSLALDNDGLATLAIENSARAPAGADLSDAGDAAPTRTLGHRLIVGFARQLHGTHEIGWRGDRYVVSATFQPRESEPEDEGEASGDP